MDLAPPRHRRSVLSIPDVDTMKILLREKRWTSKRKVRYKETGLFQWIVKKPLFENAAMVVILINSVWLAIDADYNDSAILVNAPVIFQVMEHAFCFLFTCEWLIRFMAFTTVRDAFTEVWFLFDTVLVFLMIAETWIMTFLATLMQLPAGLGSASGLRAARLLRLLRIARVMKLLRACPELLVIVKGTAQATRSVCCALIMVVILMYVFGIVFVHLLKDTNAGSLYFNSVTRAMYVLLVYGMFWDSISVVLDDLLEESFFYCFVFLVFVMLATLMLLNLLIGVLCEVVSAVSAVERDSAMMESVKAILGSQMSEIDTNNDGQITKEEFLQMIKQPRLHKVLDEVGVDVIAMLDLVDDIFHHGSLSVEEFMETIAQFKGSQVAVMKDISDLKRFLASILERISPGSISEEGTGSYFLNKWAEPRGLSEREKFSPVQVGSAQHFRRTNSSLSVVDFEHYCTPSSLPAMLEPMPPPPPPDVTALLEVLQGVVHDSRTDIMIEVNSLKEQVAQLETAVAEIRQSF